MNNIIISPSILSSDFANLEKEIKKLEDNGADWIHVDVMDGHFVPNLTIGAPVVKAVRKVTDLPLDVHLMIDNPEKYIENFAAAGSDIITFHYEAADKNCKSIIDKIHFLGKKAGISIKPKTKAKEIFQFLEDVDLVLIMTVEPGFGGQKFMSICADKIKEIVSQGNNSYILGKRQKKGMREIIIEVDGGINEQTAKYCRELGANALVAGNYIFSSTDMQQAIKLLR